MKQQLSNLSRKSATLEAAHILRVNKKSNGYSFPAAAPLINEGTKRSTDNVFARPNYTPPRMETPRPGAFDHLDIKTKGYPT
jgi:hypothetical protein